MALVRRWTWLAAAGVAGAVIAVLIALLQPPVYVASVNVVAKRARTEVNYDTRIRTVSSDVGAPNGQSTMPTVSTISAERRQTLAQLVRSSEIEKIVRAQLAETLPADQRLPGRLLKLVEGRVLPRSEIIVIEVRAPTEALASDIASVWSAAYEQQVNELYGTSVSSSPTLDAELVQSRQRYDVAESALTAFLAMSALGENTRLLESRKRLLGELLALEQSQEADLHKIAHRVDLFISQAEALQQKLAVAQDNSAAASSAVALTLLQTQAFASSMVLSTSLQVQLPSPPPPTAGGSSTPPPNVYSAPLAAADPTSELASASRALQEWTLPGNLQLQMPVPSASVTLAQQRSDVAASLNALHDWRTRLSAALTESAAAVTVSRSSRGPGGADLTSAIVMLEVQTRELQALVAQEAAQHRGLQQDRDVLWDSYTSVLKKAEENRISGLVGAGNEVSVAGQSATEAVALRLHLIAPAAAVLGMVIVAACILVNEVLVPLFVLDAVRFGGPSRQSVQPGATG